MKYTGDICIPSNKVKRGFVDELCSALTPAHINPLPAVASLSFSAQTSEQDVQLITKQEVKKKKKQWKCDLWYRDT